MLRIDSQPDAVNGETLDIRRTERRSDPMKWTAACSLAFTAFVSGCIGPADPQKHAREYLEENGHAPALIAAITEGKKIGRDEVLGLARCDSHDVRHLVAKNPYLTSQELEIFIKDGNWFVRAGAALNRSLDATQAERLSHDPHRLVPSYLVMNASVPESILLRLFEDKSRKISLSSFAFNPRCPKPIVEAIRRSDDELAKHLLGLQKSGAFN